MTIYIDPVGDSLRNFKAMTGSLQAMKQNTINQRLQMADFLNSINKNKEAEEQLWGIKNYGLSSLWAPPVQEFKAPNINQQLEPVQLMDYVMGKRGNNTADALQGEVLQGLKQEYGIGTKKADNEGFQKMMRILTGEQKPWDIPGGLPVGAPWYIPPEQVREQTKALLDAMVPAKKMSDYERAWEEEKARIEQNRQIWKENQSRNQENIRRQEENQRNRQAYGGNKEDQQIALLNDTIKAIDAAPTLAEKVKVYARYETINKAIEDHYRKKAEPLDMKYFGIDTKKGGGQKLKKVWMQNPYTGDYLTGEIGEHENINDSKVLKRLGDKWEINITPGMLNWGSPQQTYSADEIAKQKAYRESDLVEIETNAYDADTAWFDSNKRKALAKLEAQGFIPTGEKENGKTIYKKRINKNKVQIFARDDATGKLTSRGTIEEKEEQGQQRPEDKASNKYGLK